MDPSSFQGPWKAVLLCGKGQRQEFDLIFRPGERDQLIAVLSLPIQNRQHPFKIAFEGQANSSIGLFEVQQRTVRRSPFGEMVPQQLIGFLLSDMDLGVAATRVQGSIESTQWLTCSQMVFGRPKLLSPMLPKKKDGTSRRNRFKRCNERVHDWMHAYVAWEPHSDHNGRPVGLRSGGQESLPNPYSALFDSFIEPKLQSSFRRLSLHDRVRLYRFAQNPSECGFQNTSPRVQDRLKRLAAAVNSPNGPERVAIDSIAFELAQNWLVRLKATTSSSQGSRLAPQALNAVEDHIRRLSTILGVAQEGTTLVSVLEDVSRLAAAAVSTQAETPDRRRPYETGRGSHATPPPPASGVSAQGGHRTYAQEDAPDIHLTTDVDVDVLVDRPDGKRILFRGTTYDAFPFYYRRSPLRGVVSRSYRPRGSKTCGTDGQLLWYPSPSTKTSAQVVEQIKKKVLVDRQFQTACPEHAIFSVAANPSTYVSVWTKLSMAVPAVTTSLEAAREVVPVFSTPQPDTSLQLRARGQEMYLTCTGRWHDMHCSSLARQAIAFMQMSGIVLPEPIVLNIKSPKNEGTYRLFQDLDWKVIDDQHLEAERERRRREVLARQQAQRDRAERERKRQQRVATAERERRARETANRKQIQLGMAASSSSLFKAIGQSQKVWVIRRLRRNFLQKAMNTPTADCREIRPTGDKKEGAVAFEFSTGGCLNGSSCRRDSLYINDDGNVAAYTTTGSSSLGDLDSGCFERESWMPLRLGATGTLGPGARSYVVEHNDDNCTHLRCSQYGWSCANRARVGDPAFEVAVGGRVAVEQAVGVRCSAF